MEEALKSLKIGPKIEYLFAQYGQAEDISAIIGKGGIVIGDFVLQVTMTCESFSPTF